MQKNSKIFVAGHCGMVGSAIMRELEKQGYGNVVVRTRLELDLLNWQAVADFFAQEKPEYVFLAAAKVGGIEANRTQLGAFAYENLQIQNNVIHSSYLNFVKRLIFLGSSCIYPRLAKQPIKEEYLLTGALEPTNYGYAIAKIAGLKMCEAYRAQYGCDFVPVMPTNLYGINDNFDLKESHVLPALMRKFHEAKIANQPFVEVWGSGNPKRELLYVDDLAQACIYIMNNEKITELLNIGTGEDLTIRELAELMKKTVFYQGEIRFNTSMPDGAPRKCLDVSKINSYGWKAETSLAEGLKSVYQWYLENDCS
ncbi:MAG: GDP-fucose synthetase [Alphaproteobacteria bacterium RIFCSPLOWO2_01_FULL_40_26]|nr:MAG: GDP-fucose synthetase [Alphaproteobacteria bacterium RIFCSPHIGHO2_02_FULL_40_34]OFW87157.1 MAG: GDP-fucose synthetase [Alphaproteobacteria bacterium RIFCSPHIGHO2_01_FULL_40_8]OFW93978.1 MAG: GDP-fucose synthetase [Alphaproteobacteria bacterium RIFCSPLOWO2_01_FULL_40_26]OFX09690.1 MAG: GDP-fucose synthetase [Alphaproteobacteria bacterium RIFCSPLOWO2_02_FULL_40_19]OFX10839.1 MAG: GDP-fucose synthetase [Alphaproteobacteria bacterium RIFCSPLOWO2_12_FULL_40_11]